MLRPLLSLYCVVQFFVCSAQTVERKHLVMTVGGGAGMLNLASDRPDLTDQRVESGTLRCAFGYAISPRWSLGFHYDRIGTAFHGGSLEHLHVTAYMLEGSYRPWIGKFSAVECTLGIGATAGSLFPFGARLPYTSSGAVVGIGVRYLHMLGHTVGFYTALDHAASSSDEIVVNGGTVNPDGSKTRVQWNSQRISAGLLVRF